MAAKKAVVYARFSSDNQRDESIDAQLRAIEEYTNKNDIQIVKTFIDRAKSATSANRPEFQNMIKYCEGDNTGISTQGEVNPPDFENLPMITIENQTLKSLLFDNTELGTGNSYWLASNGINALKDDNFAIFGPGMVASQDGMTIVGLGNDNFCSNGDERPYSGYAGIRPVVILKSNINKDQIQKVTE